MRGERALIKQPDFCSRQEINQRKEEREKLTGRESVCVRKRRDREGERRETRRRGEKGEEPFCTYVMNLSQSEQRQNSIDL